MVKKKSGKLKKTWPVLLMLPFMDLPVSLPGKPDRKRRGPRIEDNLKDIKKIFIPGDDPLFNQDKKKKNKKKKSD